jgi:hypothetical protein
MIKILYALLHFLLKCAFSITLDFTINLNLKFYINFL